jgi:hypothetical protein
LAVVGFGQLVERLIAQVGQECRGVGDKGRFASLSPVRHRRQERRIRFDQQPILRNDLGRFLQLLGVLEGNDPEMDT